MLNVQTYSCNIWTISPKWTSSPGVLCVNRLSMIAHARLQGRETGGAPRGLSKSNPNLRGAATKGMACEL